MYEMGKGSTVPEMLRNTGVGHRFFSPPGSSRSDEVVSCHRPVVRFEMGKTKTIRRRTGTQKAGLGMCRAAAIGSLWLMVRGHRGDPKFADKFC
jgi:hypothetical protein